MNKYIMCFLFISVTTNDCQPPGEGDLVPPLEHCIRTKYVPVFHCVILYTFLYYFFLNKSEVAFLHKYLSIYTNYWIKIFAIGWLAICNIILKILDQWLWKQINDLSAMLVIFLYCLTIAVLKSK